MGFFELLPLFFCFQTLQQSSENFRRTNAKPSLNKAYLSFNTCSYRSSCTESPTFIFRARYVQGEVIFTGGHAIPLSILRLDIISIGSRLLGFFILFLLRIKSPRMLIEQKILNFLRGAQKIALATAHN